MNELKTLLLCDTPEEIEKAILDMDAEEIDRLADSLHRVAKFFKSEQLKKALIRKIVKVDLRLEAVERKCQIGQYKVGLRKSIVGQDSDGDTEKKWPSLS